MEDVRTLIAQNDQEFLETLTFIRNVIESRKRREEIKQKKADAQREEPINSVSPEKITFFESG